MLKRLFTLTVLVVLSAAFGIGLLELLIRVTLPEYNPSDMFESRYDADGLPLGVKGFAGRQWKNTGDYDVEVRINGYGFRDAKDIRESGKGDIFVVGDSFAFGWGVEEGKRYSDLLEQMAGADVYNIGAASADIGTCGRLVRYAEDNGAVVRDLIVGVCMENDIRNYAAAGRVAKEPRVTGALKSGAGPSKGMAVAVNGRPAAKHRFNIGFIKLMIRGMKPWLARRSAIYHAFTGVVHRNEMLKRLAVKAGLIIDNYEGIGKNRYSEEALAASANELIEVTEPYKAIALIVPSRGLWTGGNKAVEDRVHKEFITMLEDAGIRFVDMRPIFEDGGDPLKYHFKEDGHWNEEGHKKAAEAIFRAIQ